VTFHAVTEQDVDALRVFLRDADLTLAGLDHPTVRLWIERDEAGSVVGSTGFELSRDGAHALIRSVAVAVDRRAAGAGSRLARFALERAAQTGASCAWLFSRRSGPFWRKLGFVEADRERLAAVLPETHQVRLFTETGQLRSEVAWSRTLIDLTRQTMANRAPRRPE
jgi:N-acetylglutamate synthase-like GNAT family acetyltransferase